MTESIATSIIDLLVLLGEMTTAVLLTGVAGLLERDGLINLANGQLTLGAWEVLMGSLGLFVGLYLLGYRECWPRAGRLLTP